MAKSSGRNPYGARPLRRKVAIRDPLRTILVFCEGERTEREYLRALKRELVDSEIASVDIRIDTDAGGSVPLTLVTAAVEARHHSHRETDEIDEVWCLFDVEWPQNHPNLLEAIALAESNDVNVAISNPCFELWLALHFVDQTAWLNTNDAVRLRRRHDGSSSKGLDGVTYMARRADAARRARYLRERHLGDGTAFPHDNPSSGMHRFLEAIERRDGYGG